jgi:argininosuccinate lyase
MTVLRTAINPGQAHLFHELSHGIDVDPPLAKHEVQVQLAWARGQKRCGVLDESELAELGDGLNEALALIERGEFVWRAEDEDIHMHLERFVTERSGALGKRMHLGRSRNDLIATTLRLFAADEALKLGRSLEALAQAIADQAEGWLAILVPGMTHLQSAQPVRWGHAWSAHAWALCRDLERLSCVPRRALEYMPLGSAALCGTHLPIDLARVAQELGFKAPPANSYDAVSDRDFVLELSGALAILSTHLSRLCQDVIYWSSAPIGLLRLPSAWSSGSSIMPNKRNPDAFELIRARAARIQAMHQEMLHMTSVPQSGYASDLHEAKRTFVRLIIEAGACIQALAHALPGIEVELKSAKRLLETGHLLATDLAHEKVRAGSDFRDAYGWVAKRVADAEAQGVQVHQLEDLGRADAFEGSVEQRGNSGGTAIAAATEAIRQLRAKIASIRCF